MDTQAKTKVEEKRKTKIRVSGAEAIVRSLLEEGTDLMFGYIGGAIMPIYDVLYSYQDRLQHVMVRHEQGAMHAAQAYARISKKPGVCMSTSGPGATNLITGLADAMLDSTPMVCITGQVGSGLLGSDAFQETDVVGVSMPVTKWNFQITKAEEIPEAVAKAFFIARSGRPGPVLLDITKDAQFAELDYSYEKITQIRSYIPYPKLNLNAVSQAAEIINAAKKPFVLVGQGVLLSGAQKEFKEFVEKAEIPVGSTLLGLSAFPSNHSLFTGMLGMHGNYAPNINTNECDVLIAIGMRFDDRVTGNLKTYATQAKIIHIDLDNAEIDKNVKTDVAIVADAKQALQSLIPLVNSNTHKEWIESFSELRKVEIEKVINKDCNPTSGAIKMGEVINKLSEKTNGEAIIVTDVGQHQMASARYYQFNKTQSLVTSGGLGTMGFGLPASVGAQIAAGDKRDVYAFIGDGGFQMTIQELGTISQLNLNVKIILLNNNFLGMVRQWQDMFNEKRYAYTELTNPDFITIAKGFGIEGKTISNREDIDKTLNDLITHKGPFLLEVKVEKEANVFPMVPAGGTVSEMILE
ncbi:MAG: biosynthetic-type acetolactate synthase large subunit [Bacteroidales bacterium]|nr:biosynthetic-type acetolactate synthase large subunit [Bacteroidales bacterium]